MKNQLVVGVAALIMLAACNQNVFDPTPIHRQPVQPARFMANAKDPAETRSFALNFCDVHN